MRREGLQAGVQAVELAGRGVGALFLNFTKSPSFSPAPDLMRLSWGASAGVQRVALHGGVRAVHAIRERSGGIMSDEHHDAHTRPELVPDLVGEGAPGSHGLPHERVDVLQDGQRSAVEEEKVHQVPHDDSKHFPRHGPHHDDLVHGATKSPEAREPRGPAAPRTVKHDAHHVKTRVRLEEVLQHETPLGQHVHQAVMKADALLLVPSDRVAVVDVGSEEEPSSAQERSWRAVPHDLLRRLIVR